MTDHSLPGFTAEQSLDRNTTYYRVAGSAPGAGLADIQPQVVRRWPPGPKNCIPGCVCVSPINCPCCDSIWPWPDPIDLGGRM